MAHEAAITVNVERQRRLSPCAALIVYKEETQDPYSSGSAKEVIHFEINRNGAFIRPKALSMCHLQDIFNSPDQNGTLEYLDPRILALNNTGIVWYEPSRRTEIFFETTEEDRQDLNKLCKGKRVWWPALLFKLQNGMLHCRALQSNKRPNPDTKLFVAPLTHIAPENGQVCLPHNLHFEPGISMIANMQNFSENFYNGIFGHMTQGKLTTHPGGHDGLWREILKSPQKRFPTQYLKETNQTLKDFLRR